MGFAMQKRVCALLLLALSGAAIAADVGTVLDATGQKLNAAKESQKQIDAAADQTRELVEEYRAASKIVEDLKIYNQKLEVQTGKQAERLARMEQAIVDTKVIQRQIMPEIIQMIARLEDFIKLDLPFHNRERQQRIGFLHQSVDRPDLTVAEKFRQVLEAYKIESEYGRKIDSYIDTVPVEGADREVSILRVGRVALLYQTPDQEHSGMWDKQARKWVALDAGEYGEAIRKGLRIAQKQASVDILELPVSAPEVVK